MKKYLALLMVVFLASISITTQKANAQTCAKVVSVTLLGKSSVSYNAPFDCIVTVENPTTEQKKNIACGISINGEFPKNYCPSQTDGNYSFFGGWQGNEAYFHCVLPNTDDVAKATKLELVGDDFSPGCPQQTRVAIPLTVNQSNPSVTASPQQVSGNEAVNFVAGMLRAFQNLGDGNSSNLGSAPGSNPPTVAPPQNLPPVSTAVGSRTDKGEKDAAACGITSRTPIVGPPTLTLDRFKQVLRSYGSPALPEAESIYNLGIQYGVNPAVLLAQFIQESSCGTAGSSVRNRSIGNLECRNPSRNPCPGRFQNYPSWTASARDYYDLLRNTYANPQAWGLYYVETMLSTYAPSFENNTCQYIRLTVSRINSWR